MDDRPDRKDGGAGSVLSAAERLLAEGAGALVARIGSVGAGKGARAEDMLDDARRLRRVLLAAYQEKERVEEHWKRGNGAGRDRPGEDAGGGQGGVLDLEAARAEVGRRLARLRAAGTADSLSGGDEP